MAFYTSGDSVNAIVADLGSYASKIGYAGEDYPRSYFRSVRMLATRHKITCPVTIFVFILIKFISLLLINICHSIILFFASSERGNFA